MTLVLFLRPEEEHPFLTAAIVNSMCMEKRVFYRLMSGLHTNINVHVASNYPSERPSVHAFMAPEKVWGRNLTLFSKFFSPKTTWGEGKVNFNP